MKTTFFVVCFLCATAALGQTTFGGSTLSSEPHVFQMAGHQEHASQRSVAQEQDLLEKSHLIYAQGERPLWEVASKSYPMPLGDVARLLRKEHETARKATRVWEN